MLLKRFSHTFLFEKSVSLSYTTSRMKLNGNEWKYLLHAGLRNFGFYFVYGFGALLFYDITKSIPLVLLFGITYYGAGVVSRSLCVPTLLSLKRSVGVVGVMGIGLLIFSFMNVLIFLVSQGMFSTNMALFPILIVSGLSTGMYWLFSNIIKLANIGLSDHPGVYSAHLVVTRIIAAILATVIGIILSFEDHFTILFLISSVLLLFSLIPLARMTDLEHKDSFSFNRIFSHISPIALFSNFRLNPVVMTYGVPLFLLLNNMSLPESVLITGASYVVAAVFSHAIGHVIDHQHRSLVTISGLMIVVGYILFILVSSPMLFVLSLSIIGVATKSLRVATDTRLGKEMVKSKNNLEFMSGIEVMRNVGSAVAIAVFLIIFLAFQTLPQIIFILGAVFVIPDLLYGAGASLKKRIKS